MAWTLFTSSWLQEAMTRELSLMSSDSTVRETSGKLCPGSTRLEDNMEAVFSQPEEHFASVATAAKERT